MQTLLAPEHALVLSDRAEVDPAAHQEQAQKGAAEKDQRCQLHAQGPPAADQAMHRLSHTAVAVSLEKAECGDSSKALRAEAVLRRHVRLEYPLHTGPGQR